VLDSGHAQPVRRPCARALGLLPAQMAPAWRHEPPRSGSSSSLNLRRARVWAAFCIAALLLISLTRHAGQDSAPDGESLSNRNVSGTLAAITGYLFPSGSAGRTWNDWGGQIDLDEAAAIAGPDADALGFVKTVLEEPSKPRDVCIVGAGATGAVMAERFAAVTGKSVLVLDKRQHIAGNAFDFVEPESGLRVGRYGAHVVHTSQPMVWMYLNMHEGAPRWVKWSGTVAVESESEGPDISYPVDEKWVNRLTDTRIGTVAELQQYLDTARVPCPREGGCPNEADFLKSQVGQELYDAFFFPYFNKLFGKEPQDVAAGTGMIHTHSVLENPRSFREKHIVVPEQGYTRWFAALLDRPNIETVVGVDFFDYEAELKEACQQIVFTGTIDSYFSNSGLDPLEYRSLDFAATLHDVATNAHEQREAISHNLDWEVPHTRSVDYRLFDAVMERSSPRLRSASDKTVIMREIPMDYDPTGRSEPMWAIPTTKNLKVHAEYEALAAKEDKVAFVGKAGYQNYNLAQAVENALIKFYELAGRPAVPDMQGMFEVQNLDWMHIPKTGTSFIYTMVLYKCDSLIANAPNSTAELERIYNTVAHTRPGPPCAGATMRHQHQPTKPGLLGYTADQNSRFTIATMVRDPMVRMASGFTHSYHDCRKMEKSRFKTRPKDVCAVLEDENADPTKVEEMEKVVLMYANCVRGCQTRMATGKGCARNKPGDNEDAAAEAKRTELAIRKIQDFAFLGITDRWHQSLCLFSHHFPRPSGANYSIDNLNRNTRPSHHASCNPQVQKVLEKHGFSDEMDGPFFAAARQLFEQRLGSCAHSY